MFFRQLHFTDFLYAWEVGLLISLIFLPIFILHYRFSIAVLFNDYYPEPDINTPMCARPKAPFSHERGWHEVPGAAHKCRKIIISHANLHRKTTI